jgi:hypothetical protein
MRKNDGSVYGSTKSKCWECGEVAVTVEAEQEVERLFTLVENLKERFTGVSPEHSLRELETKSRGTEYITQDLENPAYPAEVKEELVEDNPAQESCEKLEMSENLHKLEQQLLEGMENEEHSIKGTALLERHRVRGLGEGERKCECEGTVERNKMQGEIVGKEGKPDIRIQVDVGIVLMDETEEVLEKRGGQTDKILTDNCLKKGKYSDDSECQLIEEPKVERIGKEVIKNGEEKDVRIEEELDKWRNERKEALQGDETLKETEAICEVRMENENDTRINEGSETKKLGNAKDVRIKENTEESARKSKDLFQVVENTEETDEFEEVRMKEGSNNNLSEAFKKLYIQDTFALESKKEWENVQLELEKSENIGDIFGKWKESAKFSDIHSNKKTPIELCKT